MGRVRLELQLYNRERIDRRLFARSVPGIRCLLLRHGRLSIVLERLSMKCIAPSRVVLEVGDSSNHVIKYSISSISELYKTNLST